MLEPGSITVKDVAGTLQSCGYRLGLLRPLPLWELSGLFGMRQPLWDSSKLLRHWPQGLIIYQVFSLLGMRTVVTISQILYIYISLSLPLSLSRPHLIYWLCSREPHHTNLCSEGSTGAQSELLLSHAWTLESTRLWTETL